MPQLIIISGGQTGVDRGALDAALEAGAPCDGWCPAGRLAEDGPLAARYPLREMQGAEYVSRTRQNVIDSDATVIIYFDEIQGGTARTQQFCEQYNKPCCLVNASTLSILQAAQKIEEFARANAVSRLNVAGPRASKQPTADAYCREVILKVLGQT